MIQVGLEMEFMVARLVQFMGLERVGGCQVRGCSLD